MRRLIVLVILLGGGLGAAVYYLRVSEVRVTGTRTLSPRAVIRASGLEPGDRILWERLTAAERRIEALPAVSEVVAERELPGTVVLRVRERRPIARLEGARHLVVDADGVIFDDGDADVRAVLYGWKGKARSGQRVDATSRIALDAFSRFPSPFAEWSRRLVVGRTFSVRLAGELEVRFGVPRDLEAKAQVAAAIVEAERGQRLAYVDVSSPRVPVSRGTTPPPATPAPSGAPAEPGEPAATPAAGAG